MKPYPVFITIEHHCAQGLSERVSQYMASGYVPHGSMIYGHCCKHSANDANSHYYAQPMVLPEANRPAGWEGER